MLIILSGLPGTGKTSVAQELSQELAAVVLSTDEMRKRVLREFGYAERKKKRVYDEMFQVAQDQLIKGKNVILDATFFRQELRDKAFRIGQKCQERVFLVEVVCPEDTVKKRLQERKQEKNDFSEADYRVYKIIEDKFESLQREHFVVNTENPEQWKKKTRDLANKMRVIEKQEKVIDRLKTNKNFQLKQTHISWVLLGRKHAYKIKKPVHFSFVDYSSLGKRKHFCSEENRINSLLSPDMYLGMVPITESQGTIKFGGQGEAVEYAVKMIKLPQKARMDHLLQKKKIYPHQMAEIVRILARYHSQAQTAARKYGTPEVIRANFSASFATKDTAEKFFGAGKKMDKIQSRVAEFLKKNKNLFQKRISQKRIKHCHGDIRTKNIFIHKKKVYIFDAIEFSEKISCCDVAAEVAFLAMDLNFFSQKRLAAYFVKKYIQISKDQEIGKLIDFYQCYRAMVEILVTTYTLKDAEIGKQKKKEAKNACKKYLDLAFSLSQKFS
jgi:aminoglycoside phosphotransferase family enzyme/predicted kinase